VCDQLDEERRECKADEKAKGCFEDDAVNVENVEVEPWTTAATTTPHQQFTLNENPARESINTG
jgi:hypothetical protein